MKTNNIPLRPLGPIASRLRNMASSGSSVVGLLAAIFGLSLEAGAQTVHYITLANSNNLVGLNYPVQTNQLISLVGYSWYDNVPIFGNLANGQSIRLEPQLINTLNSGATYFGPQIPQIVTGLTNITMTGGFVNPPAWATFKITTPASTTVISNYVPADAVVIPSSATGNVQIILESSPDLVNWTAASPGIYSGPAATNRFFRVRAVIQ